MLLELTRVENRMKGRRAISPSDLRLTIVFAIEEMLLNLGQIDVGDGELARFSLFRYLPSLFPQEH